MAYFDEIDLFRYKRFITREVKVGNVTLGAGNPIRVQSMTNTPTLDTRATAEQCKRIIDAGADFVRITTPAVRDAENLEAIKKLLNADGYHFPLVADVHFNPAVAEVAARIVDKVRINPGNYVDKKKFEHIDYTDAEYQQELQHIHERILPLLKICKEYGTAIRVGVNHGSLSDRIMSRYGDTPDGMAESAMEFLRIFETEGFKNTVISMKSSNTRVMVQSTRLLVDKMIAEGMRYPIHLGVTEAGEGEDGIIKSAVGIGALLADGIGDTIRVSLTGSPEQEIPVARRIVSHFDIKSITDIKNTGTLQLYDPFSYQRRQTVEVGRLGAGQAPKIVVSDNKVAVHPDDFLASSSENNFREVTHLAPQCQVDTPKTLVFCSQLQHIAGEVRSFLARMDADGNRQPVVVRRKYNESDLSELQIKAACDFGSLLIDGLADGIWVENDNAAIAPEAVYELSLNLLQASRLRMSKTEYISCPSCGRTLFDLSATTARIRQRTSHLKHLKIGIMGCIVNGPGEMADADYGYVGTGPGKITLYKSKEVVKRNVPEEDAVEELIKLIKDNGDWRNE
jgi:(E)-4-hydroxy-3-methylbut-2-enyl-diphosphate synthase